MFFNVIAAAAAKTQAGGHRRSSLREASGDEAKKIIKKQVRKCDIARLTTKIKRPNCCARRGCLCNAPDPHLVGPSSHNGSLMMEVSLASGFSIGSSKKSWSSTLSAPSMDWTKLQEKLVGPLPPLGSEKPWSGPGSHKKLAELAVKGFLESYGKDSYDSSSCSSSPRDGSSSPSVNSCRTPTPEEIDELPPIAPTTTALRSSLKGGLPIAPPSQNNTSKRSSYATGTTKRASALSDAHARTSQLLTGKQFSSKRGSLTFTQLQDDSSPASGESKPESRKSMRKSTLGNRNLIDSEAGAKQKEEEEAAAERSREAMMKFLEGPPKPAKGLSGRAMRLIAKLEAQKEASATQQRLQALPEKEMHALEKVFHRFDKDDSGSLEHTEVVNALRDLGICGTNTTEKREIAKLCRDIAMALEVSQFQAPERNSVKGKSIRKEKDKRRSTGRRKQGNDALDNHPAEHKDGEAKAKHTDKEAKGESVPGSSHFSQAFLSSRHKDTDGSSQQDEKPSTSMEAASGEKPPMPESGSRRTSGTTAGPQQGDQEDGFAVSKNLKKMFAGFSSSRLTHSLTGDFDDLSSGSEDFEGVSLGASSTENLGGYSFDFPTFATVVVPRVRKRLTEMHSSRLLRYFCHFDRDGHGKLSLGQCIEVGRSMGLDSQALHRVVAPRQAKYPDGIPFDAFEKCVGLVQEEAYRTIKDREFEIRQETGIRDDLFEEFRMIIAPVYEAFQELSEDIGSGRVISHAHALMALRTLGMMPKTWSQRTEIEALLVCELGDEENPVQLEEYYASQSNYHDFDDVLDATSQEFTFEEFLLYTKKVRGWWHLMRRTCLVQEFQRYDKDRSGALDIAEIAVLLDQLDCLPRNRKEQEELAQLIYSVDHDGSGTIDIDEFQDLFQRIEEKFSALRYEEDVDYAMTSGFKEHQLADFRSIFDALDEDGSDRLDKQEVKACLIMMKKSIDQDTFDNIFRSLDVDRSDSLDFREFIDFMRMLRDGNGIFAEDQHKLQTQARWLEDRILRTCLGYFHMSKSYLWSLDRDSLVYLFCESFQVEPSDNFHEKLQVRTLQELYALAKSCAEAPVRKL
eukprot:TRINITY_DN110788_c0_g1_i1.p1 TRINITY_DN110788_c0_g1~~TRINITY_DN110788_c0_g1_i1.p1  ORF type:complete len:1079 (+),score=223.03 TRINITY_DN110788_c0_g1_i1:92-3328(+)